MCDKFFGPTTKFKDIKDAKTRKQCCLCHGLFIFNKRLFTLTEWYISRSKNIPFSRKSAKKIMFCMLITSCKSCITLWCPVLHHTAKLGRSHSRYKSWCHHASQKGPLSPSNKCTNVTPSPSTVGFHKEHDSVLRTKYLLILRTGNFKTAKHLLITVKTLW